MSIEVSKEEHWSRQLWDKVQQISVAPSAVGWEIDRTESFCGAEIRYATACKLMLRATGEWGFLTKIPTTPEISMFTWGEVLEISLLWLLYSHDCLGGEFLAGKMRLVWILSETRMRFRLILSSMSASAAVTKWFFGISRNLLELATSKFTTS